MEYYKRIKFDCLPSDHILKLITNVKSTVPYVRPLERLTQQYICQLLNVDWNRCEIYKIMLAYFPPHSKLQIHSDTPISTTDSGTLDKAVFIPIQNCSHLHWNWYECLDDTKIWHYGSKSNWKVVPMISEVYAKLVETLLCDRPFIGNIEKWHSLHNTGDAPAIGISVRLMPWCWSSNKDWSDPPIRGVTLL
jgi:hypothetical protein